MTLKGSYDCKMTIPDPGPETTMSNTRTAQERTTGMVTATAEEAGYRL